MMTSISGELGTGKTYFLARELYEQSMAGCLCISNFQHIYSNIVVRNDPETLLEIIRQLAVLKQTGREICDLLPTFKHTGVFVAIDEAHLTFGRDSSKADMEEVILPFVSLARKQDVHIWYTVQDPATIHKTFRRYTRDWIRIRPLVPIFRTIILPHETRPTWRREKRLLIPLVWEELHHLPFDNPIFNYRVKHLEEGGSVWHQDSTIVSRGWPRRNNDPFIHSLYDSNELSGVNVDLQKQENFALLKGVQYIPHTYFPDKFPTFRKIARALGLPVRANVIPPRINISNWDMPVMETIGTKSPKLAQKAQTIPAEELIKSLNKHLEAKADPEKERENRRRIESALKNSKSLIPPQK